MAFLFCPNHHQKIRKPNKAVLGGHIVDVDVDSCSTEELAAIARRSTKSSTEESGLFTRTVRSGRMTNRNARWLRTTVATQEGNGKANGRLMKFAYEGTGFKNPQKRISNLAQIHGTPSQKQLVGSGGLVEAQRAFHANLTDRSLDPFSYRLFSGTESCFFLADDGNPSPTMIRGDLRSADIVKQSPTIAGHAVVPEILLQKKFPCLVHRHPAGSSNIHLQSSMVEAFGLNRDGGPNALDEFFIYHGGEFNCCINNAEQQSAVKETVRLSSPNMGAVPQTSSLNSRATRKTRHNGKPFHVDGQTNLKRHLKIDSNRRADWAEKSGTKLVDHFVDVIIYTLISDFFCFSFLFLPICFNYLLSTDVNVLALRAKILAGERDISVDRDMTLDRFIY